VDESQYELTIGAATADNGYIVATQSGDGVEP
jgi:hypothetical protein